MAGIVTIKKAVSEKLGIAIEEVSLSPLPDDEDADGNIIDRYSVIHKGKDHSVECYTDGEIDIYEV